MPRSYCMRKQSLHQPLCIQRSMCSNGTLSSNKPPAGLLMPWWLYRNTNNKLHTAWEFYTFYYFSKDYFAQLMPNIQHHKLALAILWKFLVWADVILTTNVFILSFFTWRWWQMVNGLGSNLKLLHAIKLFLISLGKHDFLNCQKTFLHLSKSKMSWVFWYISFWIQHQLSKICLLNFCLEMLKMST